MIPKRVIIGVLSLLTIVLAFVGADECCEDYCYDTDSDKPQTSNFATKTAYQIIKGSDSNRQFVVPNCNPVKIWLLARHGTRLPTKGSLKSLRELTDLRDEVIANYEDRHTQPDRGRLCDEDLEILKNWQWPANITEQYDQFLTAQGWADLQFLAKNYQSTFPNLLENIYSPEKFLFRHTNTQRTEASYKAFVQGLFGENAWEHIRLANSSDNRDILLRPYDSCPQWNENKEKKALIEQGKFEDSQIYHEMLAHVSSRLGFKYPLDKAQVKTIWDMCRYDVAWNLDRASAWCVAFTKSHVKILEYAEDLKYFYQSGYGEDMNKNLPCSAIADMLKHMEAKELPKVVAYFAHEALIVQLLTALGVNKDHYPLRADNFPQMSRRKFKTSEMSPFASNLAVIKYDCPNDLERNKIMFFLNQKPLNFPECNVGLCSWTKLKLQLAEFQRGDCERKFCQGSGASRRYATAAVVLLPVIYLLSRLF